MARGQAEELRPEDISVKYFRPLGDLLERLRTVGTQRDRAGNREFFFDHYASLVLLYFFNPVLSSMRSIQRASELEKVQKALGCQRVSHGSLSEAQRVFDAEVLREILGELAGRMLPVAGGREAEALKALTAVDGSLLPALPRMVWALWQSDTKRAAKLHLHFEVLKGIPARAEITAGNDSERESLRRMLEPDRLYVFDGGYESFALFQEIIDRGSSFIGRVREQTTWKVIEERSLSEAARAAGVTADLVVRLGGRKAKGVLKQQMRVVLVRTDRTGKDGQPLQLVLVTDRLDLDADLIALAYRWRWHIELFFRWLKCVLCCRHLLATSQNGVMIQVYLALIASLLISLWTGRKPNKATFEMLCHYFLGWATEAELMRHLDRLKQHAQ